MVTIEKQFAHNYPRKEMLIDNSPWQVIDFPTRDDKWRRELFPDGVFNHPAKANMYLIDALVDYLTKPGDTIIDPFGGTGTLLIAARKERRVVLIDVEEPYIELQKQTVRNWEQAGIPLAPTYIYHGDNRQVLKQLQFKCDASIFSPPYSNLMLSKGYKQSDEHKSLSNYSEEQLGQYGGATASGLNMGRLNPFYFAQAMDTLYSRLAAVLVPGAPVAVITKDFIKGEDRVLISSPTIQRCQRNGLKLVEWRKWKPHGSGMQNVQKAKGNRIVEDEDCLIFVKQ